MTLRPSLRMSSWPGLRASGLSEGWRLTLTLRPWERMLTVPSSLGARYTPRSEEHTSELQSLRHLVCRLLLEKKKTTTRKTTNRYSVYALASVSSVLVSFFFYWLCPHRDLHSFPTRRSSDLGPR